MEGLLKKMNVEKSVKNVVVDNNVSTHKSSRPLVRNRLRYRPQLWTEFFFLHFSRHGNGVHALCVFALLVNEEVDFTRHFLGKKKNCLPTIFSKLLEDLGSNLLIIKIQLKSEKIVAHLCILCTFGVIKATFSCV